MVDVVFTELHANFVASLLEDFVTLMLSGGPSSIGSVVIGGGMLELSLPAVWVELTLPAVWVSSLHGPFGLSNSGTALECISLVGV